MIYLLNGTSTSQPFPDVEQAEQEPNGLLAIGGDLTPKRLINAYSRGIFPWYNLGQPILWWAPNPRLVLFPNRLHISRSLRKNLKRGILLPTFDLAFTQVIGACSKSRGPDVGTWLVADMIHAYERLHALALAHSVEVWENGVLVGGLYGVALGQVFFGESMFSYRSDASKVALVYLAQQLNAWGYQMIDCQVRTEHLLSMGAEDISRQEFTNLLKTWILLPGRAGSWQEAENLASSEQLAKGLSGRFAVPMSE